MKLRKKVEEIPESIETNEQKIVQEIQTIFFNSNAAWNEFKKISQLFSQIQGAGEINDPAIFNLFLGRLLKNDKAISARSLMPKEGAMEELPSYSKKLEKLLKNPELHPDVKIFQPYLNILYEPRNPAGGGDSYLINLVKDKKTKQTTAIDISIFDLEGHGAEIINIKALVHRVWEVICQDETIPLEQRYQELDNFLYDLFNRGAQLDPIGVAVGMARLTNLNSESIELELYAPAGDIFIIIRDNATGRLWTKNILRTEEIELLPNELSGLVKLGYDNKESPSKIKITEFIQQKTGQKTNDWEVIMFTDGLMTGQMLKEIPAVGDDKIYNPLPDQNQISIDTTNFEVDLMAWCLDPAIKNLSGDQFWQTFYDKFASSLKNRRENSLISWDDKKHSQFDDTVILRITST